MNPRHFLNTTDNPHDKITDNVSNSFSAAARFSAFNPKRTVLPVPYSIDTPSMPEGWFSLDNSSWMPMGMSPPDTSGSLPSFQTYEVDCYSDDDYIYVVCSNWTASNQTIYFVVKMVAEE